MRKDEGQAESAIRKIYDEMCRCFCGRSVRKGTSPNRLAAALGLSVPTAYEWSSKGKDAAGQKAFRRVSIVARAAGEVARESTPARPGQIIVTGPGGLQAIGLGVVELAELLRRLGC